MSLHTIASQLRHVVARQLRAGTTSSTRAPAVTTKPPQTRSVFSAYPARSFPLRHLSSPHPPAQALLLPSPLQSTQHPFYCYQFNLKFPVTNQHT